MTTAADFEELYKAYAALAETLGKAFETGVQDPKSAVAAVLTHRECFNRIEQMNEKVRRISADWQKSISLEDAASQDRARHFIAAAKAEALRLKEICDAHADKLSTARARILNDLQNIGKGSRLLHSLRPVKSNYPKFIDSSF